MSDRLVVDVDAMVEALRQVEELHVLRNALDRHRLPTGDIDARIAWLVTAPVDVRCYFCSRRTVTVIGLASTERPLCEPCLSAACDEPYCFVPASVAITTTRGTGVWCSTHGFTALPTSGRVLVRHLVDGRRRRAAADHRACLAEAS